MKEFTQDLGILVLAAGEASRMGQAKQLLKLNKQTFLDICLQKAQALQASATVVVLGAYFDKTQPEVQAFVEKNPESNIHWEQNVAWASGMGSSIRAGIQKALAVNPTIQKVLILLADQPLVQVPQLQELIRAFQSQQKAIVASQYQETFGVPAVFSSELFTELLKLDEQVGAKKIMKQHSSQMAYYSLPEAAYDVDTPQEYQKILQLFVSL